MSTIGGLNSSAELAQLLNRVGRSSTAGSAGGTERGGRGGFDAKFKEAALASGLKAEDVDALQADIQAAVAQVKESSNGTTDDRDATKSAIDSVLQKYGVDMEKFQSAMKPPSGGPGGAGGPPPGGGPQGGGKAESQAQFMQAAEAAGLDSSSADELQEEIDATISDLLSSSSDSSDTRTSIQSAIDSLLEKYGVDLDKFTSAMQQYTGQAQTSFPLVDEQA